MNKKLIRLNESDLHRIVKESVNRVLNEAKGHSWYDKNTRQEHYNDLESLSDKYFAFARTAKEMFSNYACLLDQPLFSKSKEIFDNAMLHLNKILVRQQQRIDMKYGQQPDYRYYNNHMSQQEMNKERERYEPSEPVWHGYESLD